MNHPTKMDRKARGFLCLLLLAGVSALLLAACGGGGSSSSSEASTGETSEATETTEPANATEATGDPETTVYAEGVPTLKELYEGSNEPPPATGPAAAKDKEVIWISCGQEAAGCREPSDGFLEAAKAIGWKAKVLDGRFNVENAFANAIRSAIAQNPDAIIGFGISCSEEKTPFEEVRAAGIALVETNAADCKGDKQYNVENQWTKENLTTEEFSESYGENQAAYVIDKTEGKAKVIYTELLDAQGELMAKGFKAALEKCSECELLEAVEWESADQVPGGALEQRFRTALTKYPEANAAVMNYDGMATTSGLAKVVVDAGRQEDLLVVAGEGSAEGVELIREGQGVNAEGAAWDSAKWLPWGLVDALNRHFNGQSSVPEGLGLAVIDKEHNMPPKGQGWKAPENYIQAYEEIWAGKKEH